MIDRQARSRFAEAIRALVAGRISNDEFDSRMPTLATGDAAVVAIHEAGVWPLYSDLHEHRLVGKYALSPQDKSTLARSILFLRTDLPYEWPRLGAVRSIALGLANVITFGKARQKYIERMHAHGCVVAWPFRRQADLDAARRGSGYLGKTRDRQRVPPRPPA
jgi:hypothetical protein